MNSKNIVNIFLCSDYRKPGGIETYNYDIFLKYRNIQFKNWVIGYDDLKNVRPCLKNVANIHFTYLKQNTKYSFFEKVLAYINLFVKTLKIKNESCFLGYSRLLFPISINVFKNNDIYLFQHFKMENLIFMLKKAPFSFFSHSLKKKLLLCKKLHVFSEHDKKLLLENFPFLDKSKITFQTIIPQEIKSLEINKSGKQIDILFIGRRTAKWKNINIFLDILKYLKFKNQQIIPCIIGTKIPDVPLSNGNYSRKEIFKLLSKSKFLIVCNDREGQSIAIWEALSQNVQVIIFSKSPIYNFYKNICGIHIVSTYDEVWKIVNSYCFYETRKELSKIEKKYGYYKNNDYLDKLANK